MLHVLLEWTYDMALSSPLFQVRDKVGRRSYSSLVKVLSNPTKQSVLFDNEHQMECFTPQTSDEAKEEWRRRSIARATQLTDTVE